MPVRKQGGKLVHVLRMSIGLTDESSIRLSVIREQDRGNVSRAERVAAACMGHSVNCHSV